MMTIIVFLALTALWAVTGVQKFLASQGQSGGVSAALAYFGMAALNLAIAWFLYHRKRQREGAGR